MIKIRQLSISGVGFTELVYIKNEDNADKAYVSLFTYAVTRAVRLDLVSDLSTKEFVLALRGFLSR